MRRTALPVLEGAISSFLGFAFLAASDFEFVTKYFFDIFLAIVLFGTINALVFLPALLGLVGAGKEDDDLRAEVSAELGKEERRTSKTPGLETANKEVPETAAAPAAVPGPSTLEASEVRDASPATASLEAVSVQSV